MKLYKSTGKGLRASLMAMIFAVFSLGGYFNYAYSHVFFYLSVFAVILLVIAFVRVFSGQGNKLILTLATIFVFIGVSLSYYFCEVLKKEDVDDPQHNVELSFSR